MKIILCIDDDNMVLNALKSELKSYFSPEYVIEVAESGAEALELVAFFVKNEDDVPLVITDYIMPNMRGDEVLKQVGDLLPNTLGIMLSGQADLNGVRNAIRYGRLQSFILKPWDSADLIGNIKKTLNLHEQEKKIKQQNKNLFPQSSTGRFSFFFFLTLFIIKSLTTCLHLWMSFFFVHLFLQFLFLLLF